MAARETNDGGARSGPANLSRAGHKINRRRGTGLSVRIVHGVDRNRRQPVSSQARFVPKTMISSGQAGSENEALIQAPEPQALEQAWLPRPDEDPGWSEDPEPSARSWQVAPDGLDRFEVRFVSSAVPDPVEAGSGARAGFRFPASSRIRKSSDIKELFRRGKRKRTSHLDVFFAPSPVSRPRLGLVVPKHRHRIVDRNRLKRRLREVGRTVVLPRLHAAGADLDVLFRARREAYGARFGDLRQQMMQVTESICSRQSSSG